MAIMKELLQGAEEVAVKLHRKPHGYDQSELKSLDEIAPSISCGSVLLCSGTAAESRLIEAVDGTDFSHAAMIVRFHDDPRLYLWTADTVDKLEDQIEKESNPDHPGTHLLVLKDYLANLDVYYPSPDGSKYRFAVARLGGIDVDEKRLWSVMYEYDGTPFPPTKQEFQHWMEGQLDIDSGMLNSFCAQMVANTYQKMGWLKSIHPPNHYNPGSFAKTREINGDMTGGACLDHPQYFKL
ncbi:MAG: hypothetical protein AB2730_17785 [Candidatus Thiodiazotropha sp.]